MSPHRRVPLVVACACALAAAGTARAAPPAGAAPGPVTVGLYPFKVPGLTTPQRADLHAMLEAAVGSAARRGVLAPRAPILLPAACGDAPQAACLGDLAKGGLVLAGRGELRAGVVLLTAALWDAHGRSTREVRFVLDLALQNLRPAHEALTELEVEIEPDGTVFAGEDRPAARDPHAPAAARAPAPAPAAKAAPAPVKGGGLWDDDDDEAPAGKPAAAAKAAPEAAAPRPDRLDVSELPGPAPRWRRLAGPVLTGAGALLLAGGAAVGLVNRQRARDLDARYARGELGPGDRARYDAVRRDNVLATAMLAAGGLAAAAGGWLWITAPAPGEIVAVVGGRF